MAGTVIEYRDGVAKEYKAGDVVLADKNTTHWWQNKGTEQVVLLPRRHLQAVTRGVSVALEESVLGLRWAA